MREIPIHFANHSNEILLSKYSRINILKSCKSLKQLCYKKLNENIFLFAESIFHLPTSIINEITCLFPLGLALSYLDEIEYRQINMCEFWNFHYLRLKNIISVLREFPIYLTRNENDIDYEEEINIRDFCGDFEEIDRKQMLIDFSLKIVLANLNSVPRKHFSKIYFISEHNENDKRFQQCNYFRKFFRLFNVKKFKKIILERAKATFIPMNMV